jgi:outer membrane protein TolC
MRSRVQELELDLRKLLGLVPAAAVVFVPSLEPELRVPAERWQEIATSEGPRIALARAEHERSERRLALAVRKQWPELTLLPGFEEEDAQPRVSLGLSLPIPLWNGNAREIAVARAEREVAAEALRGELERVVQELAQAELRLQTARAERRLLEEELVPLVDRQVADGRRLAELGTLDTLLILDGLVRAYGAKAAVLAAHVEEARAAARLNSFFWPAWSVVRSEESR